MAYAFNGLTFGQFIEDAERLLASARDQEQELESLASLLEGTVVLPTSPVVGPLTTPVAVETMSASDVVDALARLRLASVEQRQLLEAMLTRLIGYQAGGGAAASRPRLLIVDD